MASIMTFRDKDGNLIDIPALQGPRGTKGDKGDKGDIGPGGVYVGTGEMPEGFQVQIDPEGEVITVDPTLTQEGMAADAKAVGDAINLPVIDLSSMVEAFQYLRFTGSGTSALWSDFENSDAVRESLLALQEGQRVRVICNYDSSSMIIDSTDGKITDSVYNDDGSLNYKCLYFSNEGYFYYFRYNEIDVDISLYSIFGGRFSYPAYASEYNQYPSYSLLRNSKLVTTDTNPSYNGEIYWTYE